MNIEAIKEQARRHEQKEEWKKALELYLRAIERLEQEQEPDVSLHNRVGDLSVRVGDLDRATRHYEEAVDLYVAAELPNNAIAVCKKIIRNVPARRSVYLKMGRIRAQQGFLTDARESFLTFAERAQAVGSTDEALRAMEELADLTPDDVKIRVTLARALEKHGRAGEAVEQLRAAHETLVAAGDSVGAADIQAKAKELDPAADFGSAQAWVPSKDVAPPGLEEMAFELGASVEAPPRSVEAPPPSVEAPPPSLEAPPRADAFVETRKEGFELGSSAAKAEPQARDDTDQTLDEQWAAAFSIVAPDAPGGGAPRKDSPSPSVTHAETPGSSFEAGEKGSPHVDAPREGPPPPLQWPDTLAGSGALSLSEEDSSADPLPLLDEAETPERDAGGMAAGASLDFEIGTIDFDVPAPRDAETHRKSERARPAAHSPEGLIAAGDLGGAERRIRELMAEEPDEVAHVQRLVEVAYRRVDTRAQADAYIELAHTLERVGRTQNAQSVYHQVIYLDPENAVARTALAAVDSAVAEVAQVASSEDYVDLGSLIFGDEPEEKTTRFLVAYEEPTGDEQADFTRMLTQFKAKVAENFGADDVRAHHDLGMAYKEMGLIDEAIGEFQAALRASRDHLPTYELLGHCFLTKGQPEAAVKSLERALTVPTQVDEEMLGIYYYLGLAYEQTGNRAQAVEYYGRVFSLDINFMDVTERLRALR